jgi:hypothetical protein
MEFNEEDQVYTYPCPCGDKFEIYVVKYHTLLLSILY